jgi:hypothetical protein
MNPITDIVDEDKRLLNKWYEELPKTEVTDNMMRWMSKYNQICSKACCFSPQCACIRCTNCQRSLTSRDMPQVRYVCLQCPIVMEGPSSAPELCHVCFESKTEALHDHSLFCEIDEVGRHTLARRSTIVPRKLLTRNDFLPAKDTEQNECVVCCEAFSLSNPAVSPAGCPRGHGESKNDAKKGIVDSKVHYCADCALEFERSRDRGTYCDIKIFCQCCQHEDEMEHWRQEFKEMFQNSNDTENLMRDLMKLHVQPWIQAIVIEEKQTCSITKQ